MKSRNLRYLVLGGALVGCAGSDDDVAARRDALGVQRHVQLVAVGKLDASGPDRAPQTAAKLENGAPGNLLGGLGSALAHAGGDTFLALPDRGPNAVVYAPTIDNTTSYVNRVQTLKLALRAADVGAALPLVLSPSLTQTTLLFAKEPLVYGKGDEREHDEAALKSGVPALNRLGRSYFVGRADNFDAASGPVPSRDARLDPEGLRVSNDGKRVYVSDEYGPYVYEFDRATGERLRTFTLPTDFGVAQKRFTELDEVAANNAGRVTNKGMEGLAITPDGRHLLGAMQSPLLQDGGAAGGFLRLVEIDLHTGAIAQYAYPLDDVGTAEAPKYAAVSEILAVNDHTFLVDERDSTGLGAGSAAVFKRVFRIDLADATEVSGLKGEAALRAAAVKKEPFLDLVAALTAHGVAATEIPAKIEGLAFGPDVTVAGAHQHTLFIASDNDFLARLTDPLHPDGVDNPNQWFVFAFDDAALPGYRPQQHDDCD
ncbi:MAG: esterase-like activity of phytase family protein [Polyangiales bacterium]